MSPSALKSKLGYRPDAATAYLEEIRQNTRFKKWLFGHYHDNRNVYYITPEFTVLHWLNVYVSRDARTWAAIHTTPAVLQAAHRPASTAMEETVAAIINPVTEAAIIEARMPLNFNC